MKVQQTTWANVQDAGLSTQAPPIPSSTPEPVEVLTDYTATIILNPTTRELTCSEKIVYTNNSDKEVSEIKLNVFINAFSASATKKPYVPEDEQLFFPLGKDYARIHFSDITALGQMLEFKLTETSLSITLPEVLPPQGSTEITLSFNAYIPLMTARTGADGRGMWFGAFLPTVAVLDKDGWHDEQYYPVGDPFYSGVANYNMTFIMPKGYCVVATGAETWYETDTERITSVKAKMARDFAFAVSDKFKTYYSKTPSGKYINLYCYSNVTSEQQNYYFEAVSRSMEYFSSVAGAYPETSIDIVETSLFTQGTTSFSSIIFFDSDGIQGTRGRDELAYEMGRQWFYGLIGTDQINAPWLGEGASAMLSQYVFHSESDVEKIMNNNYNILKQSVYSNVVLSDNLDKYSTWEQYLAQKKKAALMFYNLKEKVGNDKFYEIIKKYSVAYSYKIATGENFCRIAEEVSGINLRQFFDEWISGQT